MYRSIHLATRIGKSDHSHPRILRHNGHGVTMERHTMTFFIAIASNSFRYPEKLPALVGLGKDGQVGRFFAGKEAFASRLRWGIAFCIGQWDAADGDL
ncbi:hypothetical protein VN12_12715 [Pirellula sp. SH-Sr6A]|nr:hypothetical protein VN12_12715 [Pirellula sp. SH-Sr6A]